MVVKLFHWASCMDVASEEPNLVTNLEVGSREAMLIGCLLLPFLSLEEVFSELFLDGLELG